MAHTMAQTGGNSNSASGAGLETDVDVEGDTIASIDSHLDSWFETHAMTREDVVLAIGLVQTGMWVALLYLELQE